ncbi:Uncharacterised protein [Escherichia coli]|uniref:hypothetical protein n=1 Tax=Enterobacter mori TaxID=539813 RepID=UPI001A597186|nr:MULTISPECIES: hypothetical protein [Enterobacteriaceae]VVY56981.1 Uncharacterised protein [Escherichia coli]VVZ64540.1 Uncharacterised protein [Escherichia coli]VWN03862.1 Uncharacterised protein [Escherichia coli]
MSSDAIKMVEAFVKDPLSYDRFGPELISNQKCVLNINGHEMSIDEAVKMSDIEKGLLGEIHELIDAMTKTEANFSPGKKNLFRRVFDYLTGSEILRKVQLDIYSKVVMKLCERIPDHFKMLTSHAEITKGLEAIYAQDIHQLEIFIDAVESYLKDKNECDYNVTSNEYMAINRLRIRINNFQGVLVGLKLSRVQAQMSYETAIDVKDSLRDINDNLMPMWEGQVKSISANGVCNGIDEVAHEKFKKLVNKLNKNIR